MLTVTDSRLSSPNRFGQRDARRDRAHDEARPRADLDLHAEIVAAERAGRATDEVDLVRPRCAVVAAAPRPSAPAARCGRAVELGDDPRGGSHTPDSPDPLLDRASRPGPRPGTGTPSAGSPRRAAASRSITLEVGADERGEVGLVDHEQVGGGDARAALARHLVAAGHVDHEDLHVDEAGLNVAVRLSPPLSTRTRSSGPRPRLQLLDRVEVGGDVVADRGVRAAAGLDGEDPLGRQHAGARAGSRRPRWCRCRW